MIQRLTAQVDASGHLSPLIRQQIAAWLRHFAGQDVEIEIRKQGTRKSRDQEAGFHAMITPWAHESGHRIDDLKLDLLGEIFGWSEIPSRWGKCYPLRLHTSELSKADYSILIDRTLQIAAECGTILVAPDEFTVRKRGTR